MSSFSRKAAMGLTIALALAQVGSSVVAAEPAAKHITADELLASPFARFFKARNYAKALESLNTLSRQYPHDPLILRYRAATLLRLGRTPQAIAAYQQLLAQQPDHVPTRLFLARAYAQRGDRPRAAEQWEWIIRHSASDTYRRWAQTQLKRLRAMSARIQKAKKKPYFVGKTGLKYDSNALLKPNDKALASPGNEKAGGYLLLDLLIGYPLILRPDSRVDVLYLGQQTFHDDETDRVDFTMQGAALAVKQRERFGRHAVLFGARYDAQVSWLRSDLFSVMNRLLLSADTNLTPRTKTHVYTRLSYLNFGPDGSAPDQTSRDGFRGGLGITQYLYAEDLRRYLFIKEEVNLSQTRGANFVRRGLLSRIGAHTPVAFLPKTDFDVSTGFDVGAYPKFVSLSSLDTTRRRDVRLDVYLAVTHYWTPTLATRAMYRFINADNPNDFFDRNRHVTGLEAIFSW